MPKNRKRVVTKGAKSIGIRTKNKIGGRKSGQGTGQMKNEELIFLSPFRRRDKNKLKSELRLRGISLPS